MLTIPGHFPFLRDITTSTISPDVGELPVFIDGGGLSFYVFPVVRCEYKSLLCPPAQDVFGLGQTSFSICAWLAAG